jgi:hypothetical protein
MPSITQTSPFGRFPNNAISSATIISANAITISLRLQTAREGHFVLNHDTTEASSTLNHSCLERGTVIRHMERRGSIYTQSLRPSYSGRSALRTAGLYPWMKSETT